MAEDDEHRRVEPRSAVTGSGMLTDPERIRTIEDDKERRQRAWREPPKEGFSSVLTRVPGKEHERVGVYVAAPPRQQKPLVRAEDTPQSEPSDGDDVDKEADSAQIDADRDNAAEVEKPLSSTGRPRPNQVRDPRMASLHQALDNARPQTPANSSKTPGGPASASPKQSGRRRK